MSSTFFERATKPFKRSEILAYYQSKMPVELLTRMMTRGFPSEKILPRREIAYETANAAHVRYQQYKTSDELRKGVCKIVPRKMSAGAVYNTAMNNTRTHEICAIGRELTFDIDCNDYDRSKCCKCEDKDACEKCWVFATAAAEILSYLLRQVFGFEHQLWVFSGGRGVHCWVLDDAAFYLGSGARAYIVNQLATREKDFCSRLPVQEACQRAYFRMYGKVPVDVISCAAMFYPRIDGGVTSSLTHLLRLPFSVHPRTNRIALPFDPAAVESLKLKNMPRVSDIDLGKGKQLFEAAISLMTSVMQCQTDESRESQSVQRQL